MRRKERLTFDFDTNAWVREDFLSSRSTKGGDFELDAPEKPPAPGRWHRSEPVKVPNGQAAFAVWGAVALVIVAIVTQRIVVVAPAIMLAVIAAALNDFQNGKDRTMTDRDRQLLEDPDDPDVCLVALKIVRDGKSVGFDRGAVWFTDGMLLYSGHRTSFAIGGEDVLPRSDWGHAGFGIAENERCVPLRVDRGRAHIELFPLIDGQGGGPQEMRFLKYLYNFRLRPPKSKGLRQWPPFEP